jgi:hypothetical protein
MLASLRVNDGEPARSALLKYSPFPHEYVVVPPPGLRNQIIIPAS